MANDNTLTARGGLLPLQQPYGNVRRHYYKLTTSAVAVYIGQPMDLDTNGQAVAALTGSVGTCILVGPALGFSKDSRGKMALPDTMLDLTKGAYLPGLTEAYVCIADDPNQLFVMQEGTAPTTHIDSANVGSMAGFNYNYVTGGSGSTTTGYSYAQLDPLLISTVAGSGGLQIIALADNMNSDGSNNTYGNYAKWIVRIMNHRFSYNSINTVQ
jgi:hypothetical protein